MDQNPLVSVVINAYFSEAYLTEAVGSVLGQTLQDFEIIVWENVSHSAERVVRDIDDSRIRYFYTPDKVSLYESRVGALGEARGALIAFLDCDDYWLPSKLQRQAQVFSDPRYVVSCTDYSIYTEPEEVQSPPIYPERCVDFHAYSEDPGWLDVAMNYRVGMSTVMCRASALGGLWPGGIPKYSIIEDFDMVLRLLSVGALKSIPEILCVYRRHASNFSKNLDIEINEWQAWLASIDQFDIEYEDRLTLNQHLELFLLAMQFRNFRAVGDWQSAWRATAQLPIGKMKIKYILSFLVPTPLLKKLMSG